MTWRDCPGGVAPNSDDEERPVIEYMCTRGDPDILRHHIGKQHQPRAADNGERLHHVPVIGQQVRCAEEQGRHLGLGDLSSSLRFVFDNLPEMRFIP